MSRIIASLDIGTTKICTVISRIQEDGKIEIIGIGNKPSAGLQKGIVINIEAVVKVIKNVIEEAELMAGVEITELYTGVAGGHIESINSRGVIAVSDRSGESEITKSDIYRAIETAQSISIPPDREILHVIPQEFIVDDQEGVIDPLGMSGIRLEVEVHLVTVPKSATANIKKVIERAGYNVLDVILQPISSAEAVLSEDEKELGSIVVDIGGGTTDILMYIGNSIWYTGVISLGGNNVTKDIAFGLRTPSPSAEVIKKEHGNALVSLINKNDYTAVPMVGGREPMKVSMKMIAQIIEPRMEEIFLMIKGLIDKTGYLSKIAAGVILTGGGSQCQGTVELAERIINQPVRIGKPINLTGLCEKVDSPVFSTAIGLIRFAVGKQEEYKLEVKPSHFKVFKKITSLLKEFFN